jgi:tRNA G37 N-methylase TrmD
MFSMEKWKKVKEMEKTLELRPTLHKEKSSRMKV